MSNNLGDYQRIVIESNKVGGPKVLCAQMRAEGAVIGFFVGVAVVAIGSYVLYKKFLKKTEKCDCELNQNILANAPEYQVLCDAEDESGTVFHRGEHIKVIFKEKDMLLIYRVDDKNSSYPVSADFFTSITKSSAVD